MPARHEPRVVVLCYHGVEPNLSYSSVDSSGSTFSDHLAWLSEHTDVVPLDQITAAAEQPNRDRPTVAITFDDGYLDNYTVAFPALSGLGLPATFFLTTGLIERDESVVDHLAALWGTTGGQIKTMTWQHVGDLRKAGMELGAHAQTHHRLNGMTIGAAAEEIRISKTKIEDQLGEAVASFAYPFGKPRQHFDSGIVSEVEAAGFDRAVSILYRGVRARDHLFSIPRIPITGDSVSMLERKVQGRLDLIGMWQEKAPAWLARALSVEVAEPSDSL